MSLRKPSSAMLRGVARIVSGGVVGQGIVIVAYPVLTRIYDPAEVGLLAVFTSLVGLVAVASTGALESAVPIPVADDEAAAVAWAALVWVAGTALLSAVVALLAADPLGRVLGVPGLGGVWWLFPLAVLALGTYVVLSAWMIRERSYGSLARRNVYQGVGQVGIQVGCGLAGLRPLGLLLGLVLGRIAGCGGLVGAGGLVRHPVPDATALRATISRFRRFPQLAVPSNFVNSAGLEAPLLMVSALYGDARAGLLGLTVRVVGAPATVIGQAVTQVFTGESGAAMRRSAGRFEASVTSAVTRLVALGAVPAVLLLIAGPTLFSLVFGPEWTEAGQFARILAVAYLVQFAVGPVSSTLFLLERPGDELAWAAGRLLLTAGGPLAVGLSGASIEAAVLSVAVGHVLGYGALYLLVVRAARRSDRDAAGRAAA